MCHSTYIHVCVYIYRERLGVNYVIKKIMSKLIIVYSQKKKKKKLMIPNK